MIIIISNVSNFDDAGVFLRVSNFKDYYYKDRGKKRQGWSFDCK